MTKIEIVELIKFLKSTYASSSIGLILINDPLFLEFLNSRGYDPGSKLRLGRIDNSYYEGIDIYESVEFAKANNSYNLLFLRSSFMTYISIIGDALKVNEYFDKTPELEFFRHIRNAISHGNKFNITQPIPRPAHFKEFEIKGDLHGKPCLFEYVSTGDLFDLFDHLEDHLNKL